jgi:hypothetical protein
LPEDCQNEHTEPPKTRLGGNDSKASFHAAEGRFVGTARRGDDPRPALGI